MRRRPASRPVPAPQAPRQPLPKPLRAAALALAALLLMGWFASPVANPDTWWHLEAGRYIWQTHRLPSPDPFAFTTAAAQPAYPGEGAVRRFNLTHEWLAQTIFYLAWAAGGFPALILLRAAMLTAFCGLAGLVAFHRTGGFYRSLAAALATAAIAGNFAADRPFLFTYLLLATTIYILETGAGGRWLWLLPPIFLFWANCHGGYFLGWVALAAYCLAARTRTLWIASGLSVAVCGLNPNGFLAPWVTLAYRSSALQSSLWEWHRPQLWPPDLFAAVLFAAAAVLAWRFRKVRLADWILFAAFAAASLVAVRNTILIAWLGPMLIAAYLPFAPAPPRWAQFATAGLALAAFAELFYGSPFQLRAEEWLYPKGAADFLLAHRISGPLFNTYEHGGYLMWRLWPKLQVFIDGRALSDSLFHDYQRMLYALPAADSEKSGLDLLDQYGIRTIVVNGFEYGSGAVYLLPVALANARQSEFKLVYRDEQAMVFLRHPPPDLTPLEPAAALDGMEAECSAHISRLPGEPACARYLGILFTRAGQPERGRRWTAVFEQLAR